MPVQGGRRAAMSRHGFLPCSATGNLELSRRARAGRRKCGSIRGCRRKRGRAAGGAVVHDQFTRVISVGASKLEQFSRRRGRCGAGDARGRVPKVRHLPTVWHNMPGREFPVPGRPGSGRRDEDGRTAGEARPLLLAACNTPLVTCHSGFTAALPTRPEPDRAREGHRRLSKDSESQGRPGRPRAGRRTGREPGRGRGAPMRRWAR